MYIVCDTPLCLKQYIERHFVGGAIWSEDKTKSVYIHNKLQYFINKFKIEYLTMCWGVCLFVCVHVSMISKIRIVFKKQNAEVIRYLQIV